MALFATMTISGQAQLFNRQPTPNDTLQSVRQLTNGDVLFSIYAPQAKNVGITGDIMPWDRQPRVVKNDNGVWTITVSGVKAGAYRYAFVVDGVRVYDPKAPMAHETSAVASLPQNGSEFFQMKDVPHGAVAQRYYHSKTTNSTRRLHVWTPAGYEKSDEALPVFYLIHGGGDTDNAWPTVGCAGHILDNLLAEGKIKPMVVVMPNGSIEGADLYAEVPLFEKDLTGSIIPFIESNYRVLTDKDHRALAGLSMGGLETLETFMAHPDMFAYINVMSSGWWQEQKQLFEQGDQRLKEIAPVLNKSVRHLLFTQGGPEDIAYKNGLAMLEVFKKHGVKYDFSEMPGGHTWHVWRHDLYNFAQKLFKLIINVKYNNKT